MRMKRLVFSKDITKSLLRRIFETTAPRVPQYHDYRSLLLGQKKTNSKHPMIKSRKFILLALAIAAGVAPLLTTALAQGDTFVTMCYKTRTIQIPFYLRLRYMGAGATDGPCGPSS